MNGLMGMGALDPDFAPDYDEYKEDDLCRYCDRECTDDDAGVCPICEAKRAN